MRCLFHYNRRHLQATLQLLNPCDFLFHFVDFSFLISTQSKRGLSGKKMGEVSGSRRQIYCWVFAALAVVGFGLSVAAAHQCSHGHHHHVHDDEDVGLMKKNQGQQTLLPEELAEEEDLKMMWAHHDHDHYFENGHHEHNSLVELSGFGLWISAMGCSLLVSLASLICLILLPLIFTQGKPSKTVIDSLALFGAGAMLGDAFLHQLPHAFGGEHSHSHDHHDEHHQELSYLHSHSHSHSLKDLSVGLSILAGIVVFLIVEKLVRYVEEYSGGVGLGHHHHHKHSNKFKDDDHVHENHQAQSHNEKSSEGNEMDKPASKSRNGQSGKDSLRKISGTSAPEDLHAEKIISNDNVNSSERSEFINPHSNLVFGYLNLFSDGMHNFTDGMALGSAFLLYGSVGGWSRTLFLLTHELPQEIGDFGILVRSGFSATKALFFNFLSALVALVGTALALMWGSDPGHSSLIEGFTAGGFIYIALAGVLAEMNNGTTTLKNTAIQLISLLLGMAVALCISLVQ